MIAYADFFTGIAGCVIAAELAGFTPVSFCEIEEFPRRLLKHYWPEVPILHDIRTVTADDVRGIGRIDVAHFSPPCQSLSIAGKQEATEDLRYLWPDTARVISLLRPTWVVIENVDNAVNLVLDDWLADLDRLGYDTAAIVLPAAAVGAPHIRNRLYLVAHAKRVEPERRGEYRFMADPTSEHQGGEEERERVWNAVGHSGSVVADSNGFSLERDWPDRLPIAGEATTASRCRCSSRGGGTATTTLGDTAFLRHERPWDSWDRRHGSESSDPCARTGEQTEPRLGGNVDVIPGFMDRYSRGEVNDEPMDAAQTSAEGVPSDDAMRGMRIDQSRPETSRGLTEAAGGEIPVSSLPRKGGYGTGQVGARSQEVEGLHHLRQGVHGIQSHSSEDVFEGVPERSMSQDGIQALASYTFRGLTWNGWPAGKGPHQYDDEPPRTAGKLKERRARIKAIGNAVPPAQIYPIFKAIAHEIRACQP